MIELHPKASQAYKLFHDGTLALERAERQGFRVDTKLLVKNQKKLTKKINKAEKKFIESKFYINWNKSVNGTININSNKQLETYLYKTLKIKPPKETAKGSGSTDAETLKLLNIPELDILLQITKYKKIRDTFLEGILREQVDGVLHPFYTLGNVTSYRGASSNPNWQNQPKRDKYAMNMIRGTIFPRKGNQLLEIDFKSLEVSIGIAYHKDPKMLTYLMDKSTDMHRDMMKEIFKIKKFNTDSKEHSTLRSATKNGFIFPQFYGDFYKNNANSLAVIWCGLPKTKWKNGMGMEFEKGNISDHLIKNGIKSYLQFEKHLQSIEYDFWNKRFKVYKKWKDNWWNSYQEKGYFDTYTGFRTYGILDKKQVCNWVVQGSAFHCLLWSLIEVDKVLYRDGWKSRILGQVHDSIIFDVYPKELKKLIKLVKRITTVELPKHYDWINVPLSIDAELAPIDGSWAEMETYKIN